VRVRRLIRKVVRSVAPRLGAATMAVVFLTMGGGGAKSVHSASHESHPGHVIAAETTASDHTSHAPDTHAAHHGGATSEKSDETPQDPATECTCVGPCHGGTAPSEYRTTSYEVAEGEVQKVLAAPHVARIVYRNASAHILPLPTAPPSHV
jgi:hypothetical protein